MKKLCKMASLIFMLCVMLSNVSFAANRVVYDIEQESQSAYNITLKWNEADAGNIQLTAFEKMDDNTITIYYKAYSNFNVRKARVNIDDLGLSLTEVRTPMVTLKNAEGKSNAPADLPKDDEASKAIQNLYARGIINGYTDGTFKPESNISREEFSSLFCKFMKYPLRTDLETKFSDVLNTRWSKNVIMTLYDKQILKGTGDSIFAPSNNITLGEVSAIIDRAKGLGTIPVTVAYKHLQKQHWANANITNLLTEGYIKVTDNFYANFDQNKPLTRGEMAVILNRD